MYDSRHNNNTMNMPACLEVEESGNSQQNNNNRGAKEQQEEQKHNENQVLGGINKATPATGSMLAC